MSCWICCNSCFLSPSADRRLGFSTCGHVICSVCYQKGKPGKCLICGATCQILPLSDKSSPDVKSLFSDISTVTNKHLAEISKVVMFQARHQKRLLNYYQQRNEKLEEVLVQMKQEMQQMSKKLNEQSSYIAKLENILHSQSRSQGAALTPDLPYSQTSRWKSPIFRLPSSFRHSMSSLVCPPP
ncbi:putative E3 SUMO-protein ligase RNF212 [Pholidichthys leucotaenia]